MNHKWHPDLTQTLCRSIDKWRQNNLTRYLKSNSLDLFYYNNFYLLPSPNPQWTLCSWNCRQCRPWPATSCRRPLSSWTATSKRRPCCCWPHRRPRLSLRRVLRPSSPWPAFPRPPDRRWPSIRWTRGRSACDPRQLSPPIPLRQNIFFLNLQLILFNE